MTAAKTNPDTLVLSYDLFDLPTAQHKAGLAGLLVMIDSMQRRRMNNCPNVLSVTSHEASIEFTRESFHVLFEDLYDAILVEKSTRNKPENVEVKRVESKETEKGGKKTTQIIYFYEETQPKGEFLRVFLDDENWLDLWRKLLWDTLNIKPTTREVYKDSKKKASRISNLWLDLSSSQNLKKIGKTCGFGSSLYIGAQAENAERIPFQGPPLHNLLLHFWTIVSLVFVARKLLRSRDRVSKRIYKFSGYVLAIPEPANLKYFCEEVIEVLQSLKCGLWDKYPESAVIDVPQESGLEFLYRLAKSSASNREMAFSLSSVEMYHLERDSKNTRTRAAERVVPDSYMLDRFNVLRKTCKNPLFRTQRILNLLRSHPWYHDMDDVFSQYGSEFFIQKQGKTPHEFIFFGKDVKRTVLHLKQDLYEARGYNAMSVEDFDDSLALGIYEMIGSYVVKKTETKSGLKIEQFKNDKDGKGRIKYPSAYREAREKVCSEAFLAIRGRQDQDFMDYFSGTICSVPQNLTKDYFLAVSRTLATDWIKVKNLTLLALSAHSYLEPSS